MGDSALVVGNLDQPARIVPEDQSDGSRPHCTAVSRGRCRNAGGFPALARDQLAGCVLRRSAASDDAVLSEKVCDPPRVIVPIEAAPADKALQKLPRKLRVIRILSELVGWPTALACLAGHQFGLDIARANLGGVSLDHEPKRIADALSDERA